LGKKVPIKAGIEFDVPDTNMMSPQEYNILIAQLLAICMGCLTITDVTIDDETFGLPNFYQLLQGTTDIRENLS
jgi:hypothetical protein